MLLVSLCSHLCNVVHVVIIAVRETPAVKTGCYAEQKSTLLLLLTTSSRRLRPTTVHTAFTFQPASLGASFRFAWSCWCSFKVRTGLSAVEQAVRTLKPDRECAQIGMLPAIGVRFPFPCTLVVSSLLV